MKIYSVLAVDDEGPALRRLEKLVTAHTRLKLIGTAKYSFEAKELIENLNPEVLLLDIQLKDATAFDLLESIPSFKGLIVFITAFDNYAIKAFEYGAIDYLLKPYNADRFFNTINRIISNDSRNSIIDILKVFNASGFDLSLPKYTEYESTLFIKSGPQLYKICVNDILYLEKDGNYLTFHTHEKKILSRQNMKDIFEILSPKEFIRVHKSFVVAIKHMEIIESHQIRIGSIKIPVGRNYREDFMKIIEK